MTEKKRRQSTMEFKKEAVELVTRENYTVAEAARGLGISRSMLDRGGVNTGRWPGWLMDNRYGNYGE